MKKLLLTILAVVLSTGELSAQQNNATPANLGGTLYASTFAGWTVAKGNNGPFSWSSSSVCTQMSVGGVSFKPFVVGTPIRIVDQGSPVLSENVTVTAVNIFGSGCSIGTTQPANQHNSFYLTTATAGLQEAINYSIQNLGSVSPASVIILTPDWSRVGGNDGLITSVQGNANITVLDERTSVILPYVWTGIPAVYTPQPFSGGGTTPVAPAFSPQLANAGVNGLTTDPALLVNTATHNLTEQLLNNIPYASQFQTGGGGNGVANLFTGPNMFGIKDNGDITDPATQAPTSGSILMDLTAGGTFGNRFTNCNSLNGNSFFLAPNMPFQIDQTFGCATNVAIQTAVVPGQNSSVGPLNSLSYCEYPGYDLGNPNQVRGGDGGWTGCGPTTFGQIAYSQGISNNMNITTFKYAAGDENVLEFWVANDGGQTAGSDQGTTIIGVNGGQNQATWVETTVASTTGTGDTDPVISAFPWARGNHFTPGSPGGAFALRTSNAAGVDQAIANVNLVSTTGYPAGGVTNIFLNISQGSGQTDSAGITLTSVAVPSAGVAVYTGTVTGGAADALAGQQWTFGGFSNDFNNGTHTIVHSTATTVTVNNPNATADVGSASAGAAHLWPVTCSGGGGTGASAGVFIVGGVAPNNPQFDSINPGTGYTSNPICTVVGAGGTPAQFTGVLSAAGKEMTVTGTALTPSTGDCISTMYVSKGVPDMTQKISPLTCTSQHGKAMVNGPFWFVSDATPEMCIASSVTAPDANHSQTMNVSCHLPHISQSQMFQGGTNGYVWFNADAAGDAATQPWPFSTFVFGARDTTHFYYGYLLSGGMGNNTIPLVGHQRESFTAPNNTAKIYKGAQVVSTKNFGTTPHFNVSDAPWAAGDHITQVLNPTFAEVVLLSDTQGNAPMNSSGGSQIDLFYRGNNFTAGQTMLNMINLNGYGMYAGCDVTSGTFGSGIGCKPVTTVQGWAFSPTAMTINGPFNSYFRTPAPLQAVWIVDNLNPVRAYNLFETGGGVISVDPVGFNIGFSSNVHIAGNANVDSSVNVAGNVTLFGGTVTAGTVTLTRSFDGSGGNPFAFGFSLNGQPDQANFVSIGQANNINLLHFSDSNAVFSAGQFAAGQMYAGAQPAINKFVFVTGAPGTTVVTYCAAYRTSAGTTDCSDTIATGTSNASLALSANFVKFVPGPGTVDFDIYRTTNTGGFSQGLICAHVANSAQGCFDTGAAAGAAPPTTDTSGLSIVHGSTQLFGTATLNGDAICTVVTCPPGGITLTTTGTSGPATLISGVLNIPQYSGGGTGVTSVAVTGANGIGVSGSPITSTGTIALTLGAITPTSTNGVLAATMAFMDATSSVQTQLNLLAPKASPALTGVPTAPTAANGTNTTQIATTAYVLANGGGVAGGTLGFLSKYSTGGTSLVNSLCDEGQTTANVFTCADTAGAAFVGQVAITSASGVGGGDSYGEGTATSGASGRDILYALSSSHRLTMNNNNAGALSLVGIGTAGTAGHVAQFAANGIDVIDSGTPFLGAATATSLLATATLDGLASTTITTGTTATLNAFLSGYWWNENATAATAVAYTLPTAAAGLQKCVGNGWNGSAATTGVLTVNTSAAGQFIVFTDGSLSATGGNVTSGGAAADAACFVGIDPTHWQINVVRGTWTKH